MFYADYMLKVYIVYFCKYDSENLFSGENKINTTTIKT